MKKTAIAVAMLATLGVTGAAQAATLNNGDILTITTGTPAYDNYGNQINVTSGSWFGMDTDKNSKIANTEKEEIYGLAGITVGTSTAGPSGIDTWNFFGPTGTDWLSSPVSGSTTAGLDFTGWTVNWNGGDIPMSGGAWNPLNCGALGIVSCAFSNGVAQFDWDGNYGSTYSLWYTATVPSGSFTGVQYILRLTGTVMQGQGGEVPVPAAAWLLGSGLVGLVGVARRKAAKA